MPPALRLAASCSCRSLYGRARLRLDNGCPDFQRSTSPGTCGTIASCPGRWARAGSRSWCNCHCRFDRVRLRPDSGYRGCRRSTCLDTCGTNANYPGRARWRRYRRCGNCPNQHCRARHRPDSGFPDYRQSRDPGIYGTTASSPARPKRWCSVPAYKRRNRRRCARRQPGEADIVYGGCPPETVHVLV
jgi:hypothetical protein